MDGSRRVRVDLVIFPKGAEHTVQNAWILIECKRDSVPPSARKDGVGQLTSYLSSCPNAEWGMWTNGRFKEVLRRVHTGSGFAWENPNDIPANGADAEEVDRPTRDSLSHAANDNLLFSFRICHNHIYVTDGLHKQAAFFELLKVIFCKIHDERNVGHPLQFYATAREKASTDGRLTVARRLGRVFEAVKKRYPKIFEPNAEIALQPRSLAYIVGELQRYSFLNTQIDVKGKAYEELVGANLRGDRGEFFTPRNVQRMAVRMLDIKVGERVLDPACGTGGFLVIALNEVIEKLRTQVKTKESNSEAVRAALLDRIHEVARTCFFGFDINPDLVKATKMNMVMNNDGSGNILRQDSLLHPHEWDHDFRKALAAALDIEEAGFCGPADLGHFDVIATNPPFGAKLPIKDQKTLAQFELGRVWKDEGGEWKPTDQLQASQPPEILFVERCWQLLRPGGRMAVVLPDAILGAPGLGYVRQWILNRCRVVASIDLHPDTFQPRNGTQTSVLVLQRKDTDEMTREAIQNQLNDYNIFMSVVEAIGHDKRGNHIYVRDDNGKILWFPADDSILRLERMADGDGTVRPEPKEKRRDDHTADVADEFLGWKEAQVLGW
jgi:type I restriction enzyme M protein